jgi:hypothetical protein
MNWLDELVEQHKEFESPIAFWRWAGLATIAATMRDKVWLDKYLYKLYPNIYVMLHADSGLKKGPPVSMAKQLVNLVGNTRVITGRSSIQGILKEMGTAYTTPGGQVIKDAIAFICSSELTSSIVEDKVATDILTDLYDRAYNQGAWKSLLKMESFSLNNPNINILSATNEAHSEQFFQKKDMQGGYFARTFIIYENKRNKVNSLMFKPEKAPDYPELAKYLKELTKLEGGFEIAHEDRVFFNDWYIEFKKKVDSHDEKDATGTLNRFDDSVMKVAMLLSLAEKPELVISRHAMETAISYCEQLVGNVRKTTLGSGKSQWAQQKANVINELLTRPNHAITRQVLNKKYWMHASAVEWDDIMVSLEAAGVVEIQRMGNQILYVMPEKAVHEWSQHLKGK